MSYRILIPSYTKESQKNTLRYELCEIIYEHYKATTFFVSAVLKDKIDTLEKVKKFFKTHPEILQYKDNEKYWYPYENVDGTRNLNLYVNFYPNTSEEITYFCKEEEENHKDYDYLFDPLKLHFFLMRTDVKQMNNDSENAKKIISINNELFSILLENVGDVKSYNGLKTLQHINKAFEETKEKIEEIKNNSKYDKILKNELSRSYIDMNKSSHIFNDVQKMCYEYKLKKELPHKIGRDLSHKIEKDKMKIKI